MCCKCVCSGDVVIIKNPVICDENIENNLELFIQFPYVAVCKKCKSVFPLHLNSKLLSIGKLGAEIAWNNIAMDLYMINENIKNPIETIQLYKDYKEGNYYE